MTPEQLADLLAAALPDELLSADELRATLFEDPDGAVLGSPTAAAPSVSRCEEATGFVTVLAVHPSRAATRPRAVVAGRSARLVAGPRRRGGATGAAAPRYLWPGVDVEAHAPAVALFEAAGYGGRRDAQPLVPDRVPGTGADRHRRPSRRRSVRPTPTPCSPSRRRRSRTGSTRSARALPHGCCHGAFETEGTAVGFACHSVNRAGWIGPMATDERLSWSRRRRWRCSVPCAATWRWPGSTRPRSPGSGPTASTRRPARHRSRRFVVLGRQL